MSDGWELTIDDDVFGLTASEETIDLPDGAVGEELVTPSGGEATEIVAPDGTVVFDSFDIPDAGLLHDYHAAELNLSEGETVSTFTDQSGDDDLSAQDSPTFRESGINGEPAVEYDGIDDGHESNSAGTTPPWVVFLVVDPTNTGSFTVPWADARTSEVDAMFRFDQSGDEYRLELADAGDIEGGTVTTEPIITTWIADDSDNYQAVRENGSVEVEDTNASVGSNDLLDGLNLGGDIDVDRRYMEGFVGRKLVYDLGQLEQESSIDAVESGLADEYGINLS